MFSQDLFDPESLRRLLFLIPAFLLSLTIHEFAHGWMAWRLGDDTAKRMGRVSLNPLVHLDLVGTLALVLTGLIGWAKPVPVNPWLFRRKGRDMILVSLAGPLSNAAMAILFALMAKAVLISGFDVVSIVLDSGSASTVVTVLLTFLMLAVMLNIALAVFNLIPIPPLDGFQVVSAFLPESVDHFLRRFQMVFFIALFVLVYKGFFSRIIFYFSDKIHQFMFG